MKNIGDYFGEITGNKTSLIAFKNLSNSGAKISAEKELNINCEKHYKWKYYKRNSA